MAPFFGRVLSSVRGVVKSWSATSRVGVFNVEHVAPKSVVMPSVSGTTFLPQAVEDSRLQELEGLISNLSIARRGAQAEVSKPRGGVQSDDIQSLVGTILKAAGGEPLDRSMSREKELEESAASLIRRLLLLRMDQEEDSDSLSTPGSSSENRDD